jgi:hypothetical protein
MYHLGCLQEGGPVSLGSSIAWLRRSVMLLAVWMLAELLDARIGRP